MIATLVLWLFVSSVTVVIKSILAYHAWRAHERAMRFLCVSVVGSVIDNALIAFVAWNVLRLTQGDAPPSLNVVLLTIGHTIHVATSLLFSVYVLGLLNGGTPKIKDVSHD